MQNLDRTRLIFFAVVGIAILVVGCGVAYSMITSLIDQAKAAPTPGVVNVPAGSTAKPPELTSPDPVYAAGYKAGSDKLPTYICAADSFGSYFVLQQMQISGKDVAHGFHLGIVPFSLDGDSAYDVSEEQRKALLIAGKWDCLLMTLESTSLSSPGIVTAIVDESAGADQLWARNVPTLNDLKGKRIAFSRGSVGEYFVYYALSIARLNPRFDVTLVPKDSVSEAVDAFNQNQADVVSGWEPDIYNAKDGGGVALLSSSQMRIVMDVIVTSRISIANRPDQVQAFHDAWFDTLKFQLENFDSSAKQIADWGHNDWTFVYAASASADLTSWLKTVAQADLGDNTFVMRDPTPIIARLETARRVWAAAGMQVPNDNAIDLINPSFVANSAAQANLKASANPLNDSFSLTAKVELSGIDPNDAVTLAVLPCRRFAFLPESTTLTLESRRILDECVLPTLSQSVGLYLRVKGSSAWPGPKGAYSEKDILDFGQARGQSVVDYLVSKGIDPARFIVESTLPPADRRETDDPEKQAEDRFVEMTLITVGR